MFKEIDKCRICGNTELRPVIDLGKQMLTGVFPASKDISVTSGPLVLVKCVGEQHCGLLQLSGVYDPSEMYGSNYGYRSGLNSSMVAHLRAKVSRILKLCPPRDGDLIVDIGSNDGTTLVAYPEGKYNLVGIDPTGAKFANFYPPHVQLIPEFFSAETVRAKYGSMKAKVVTSFSMFYDLDEPQKFVKEVAEILDDNGIWVFEQSYLGSMLATNSYDTICHEHLEYYAVKQILWMTDKANLKIVDIEFNDVNGGSFSVTVAKHGSNLPVAAELDSILRREQSLNLDSLQTYKAFADRIEKSRTDLLELFERVRKENKSICGLGASTKGNVLLQYSGISTNELPFIGEVNKEKFGCYTPGTYIPIISEDEVLKMKPDYLLVLPWHFKSFFLKQEKLKISSLVFPLPDLEIISQDR
jgi:hypothetical protein